MITRSSSSYYTLPKELTGGKKAQEAKTSISMRMVVPPEMEKKAQKWMGEMAEEYAKKFRKFMEKEVEKRMK